MSIYKRDDWGREKYGGQGVMLRLRVALVGYLGHPSFLFLL